MKRRNIEESSAGMSQRRRTAFRTRFGAVSAACSLVISGIAVVSFDSGGSAATKVPTYKFGLLVPLTGDAASFGLEWEKDAGIFVKYFNSTHKNVKLADYVVDSQNSATGAVVGMSQLVSVDKVPYVVSGGSAVVTAIHASSEEHKVVVMNQGGEGMGLALGGYAFNSIPLVNLEFAGVIPYAENTLNISKYAIVYTDDALGESSLPYLEAQIKKDNGTVVNTESVDPTSLSFTSQVSAIAASGAQGVYILMDGDQNLLDLEQQLREGGVNVPILTYSGGDASGTSTLAANQSSLFFTSQDLTYTNAISKLFLKSFKAENKGASPTPFDSNMYDAASIFGTAVVHLMAEKKTVTGANIRAFIKASPTFDYVGGPFTFTPQQTVLESLALNEVENNNFVVLKTLSLKTLEGAVAKN